MNPWPQIKATEHLHSTSVTSHSDIFCFLYQGSGKTLAFGIPILNHILQHKASQDTEGTSKNEGEDIAKTSTPVPDSSTACSDEIRRPLLGLIMTPTRELALQIRNHLQKAAKHTSLEVQVWEYIIIEDLQSGFITSLFSWFPFIKHLVQWHYYMYNWAI